MPRLRLLQSRGRLQFRRQTTPAIEGNPSELSPPPPRHISYANRNLSLTPIQTYIFPIHRCPSLSFLLSLTFVPVVPHFRSRCQAAGLEAPQVNQIELHVFLQQRETVAYCEKEGITIMGYAPLARCKKFGKSQVMADIVKEVQAAAKANANDNLKAITCGYMGTMGGKNVTEADIYIRWSLQKGYITIPKSSNRGRIISNSSRVFKFQLTPDQMARLHELDCGFKSSGSVNNMDLPWDEVK